ncbi:tRNA pseudouridine38-40 synthase [Collimonas sp. OK242]|uniref:tRNA pseudouridine(38-40) synthase TruA n=1 Tax=Collimonas sp. OK242 TaxID=1798195 RepID=UPI0008947233|nr:tRNA pseudouridine(38-40) synthase TruA [Collimonas sp. OK242]SDY42821.1 tRNA pseudouridine38-40 synthase [Collimonas sp. OK242]
MKRIVLGVQYDGTPWQGWQTQPNGKTVQDRLEAALQKFTQGPIDTTCAGRTDSGVHALEQVVHFDTPLSREIFSWVRGLNAFLPSSIAVRWAHELSAPAEGDVADRGAGDQFHARFSATARTYHYLLYNNPVRSPLLEGKAGWVFRPLELDLMRQAAAHLVGTHDFSAFRAVECQAKSPVRTMEEVRIERRGDLIVFSLRANAFLHHMVRNIVGSLIYAGNGSKPPEWIAELLLQRDRGLAAPTFMPDGLYLAQVAYDPKWRLPQQPAGLMPWL